MTTCQHAATEIRRRTFRDSSIHAVRQCLNCGAHVCCVAFEKLPAMVAALPAFDETLHANGGPLKQTTRDLFDGTEGWQ